MAHVRIEHVRREHARSMEPVRMEHYRVAIIGAGFAGLGTAIRLRQQGETSFVVLERAGEVGGVWRDNTYPGCACDVQSHLYSFSFAPNPSWSRRYSPQAEIQEYLKDCVDRFEIGGHLRFGQELQSARWDGEARRWLIQTSGGALTASVLVSGAGALSEPSIPRLPGLDSFQGRAFHSSRWDHSYDLAEKRVAVIGTGASAIQFIPQIQPRVARLTVYQRTPPWVVPRLDGPIGPGARRLLRSSRLARAALRAQLFLTRELFALPFLRPALAKLVRLLALHFLKRSVPDPALRATLTPKYEFGCKRILLSDDYYPSLQHSNVEVVNGAVTEIRARSVIGADGVEREIDALIFGTGFEVQDLPIAKRIHGRDGRTLEQAWGQSPRAHLGTTVNGFPNLFILQGPNTGLGHTSVILMIESQIDHLLSALKYMRERKLLSIEPRQKAQDAFNATVDRKMQRTVWLAGGCRSWYLDRTGRNFTLWPGFTLSFRSRVQTFNSAEYQCETGAPRGA
jgi:cation diffusion facilitator CzcD-associated flavoprotein CzcO